MSESQGTGLSPDDQSKFDWRAPPARVSTTPGRTHASTERSEGELPEVATPEPEGLFGRFRRVTFGIPPGTPDVPLPRAVEEGGEVETDVELPTEERVRQNDAMRTVRPTLLTWIRLKREELRRKKMATDAEVLAANTFSISPHDNPLTFPPKQV